MTKSWNDLEDMVTATQAVTEYNNLLLVDANNLAYRYVQRKNFDSYTEDFKKTIQSLAKSYQAKHVIVCFDFGKSIYRNKLIDAYKGNRKKAETPEEIAHFEQFFAVLNNLPDELDEQVLKFRGVEADDLITYLAENISDRYEHTWIISSDKDLRQLLSDKISIFNIYSRKEITADSLFEETGLTPTEYMVSRLIQGETGDNIIGIEGIGVARAEALVKKYKTLDNLLAALPIKGSKAKYIANLNAGKEILLVNEKLANLKKYNTEAISACADPNIFEILEEL